MNVCGIACTLRGGKGEIGGLWPAPTRVGGQCTARRPAVPLGSLFRRVV